MLLIYSRAKDRLTIQEREREEAKARQLEKEAIRAAEDRRRQTLRIVEDEVIPKSFIVLFQKSRTQGSATVILVCFMN